MILVVLPAFDATPSRRFSITVWVYHRLVYLDDLPAPWYGGPADSSRSYLLAQMLGPSRCSAVEIISVSVEPTQGRCLTNGMIYRLAASEGEAVIQLQIYPHGSASPHCNYPTEIPLREGEW